MQTRSPKNIMDEARSIVSEWKRQPRNYSKPPGQVARLLALRDERAISDADFARQVGLSVTTVYLWGKGLRTSGNAWPELVAERAMRRGAAAAAMMNAELPAPPRQAARHPDPSADQAEVARGLVAALRRRLEDSPGAFGVADAVDIVSTYRRTRYGISYFAKKVGISADDLRHWNAGRVASGAAAWPELAAGLRALQIEPSRRHPKAKAEPDQPRTTKPRTSKPSTARPKVDILAVPVTKFRAVDGSEHDDAGSARAHSLRHSVVVSARALAKAIEDDESVHALVSSPREVIALADAHRALLAN